MVRQSPLITQKKPLPGKYEERLEFRRYVTPQSLAAAPVHRWFAFPHSFGRELVWELMDEWGLGPGDRILDPFVGAGTSLLAAKERGISATGVDLSPLAVFVTRTKLVDYAIHDLEAARSRIISGSLKAYLSAIPDNNAVLKKWFTPEVLQILNGLKASIFQEEDAHIRNFFLLGLLSILSEFSLVVRDGGWLRWQKKQVEAEAILPRFQTKIANMIDDLQRIAFPCSKNAEYSVIIGDARNLEVGGVYSAVITSPPYPNRHDYSRIFNVELCFAFMDQSQVRELRYQSFRSHVEARQGGYGDIIEMPESYRTLINNLKDRKVERRVPGMLNGYFQDMFYTLISLKARLIKGGKLAFVVGNVRYKGEMVYVDDLLAYLAQKAGYKWVKTWIVRYRGNSAQQMGNYGREAARESIVILENINLQS